MFSGGGNRSTNSRGSAASAHGASALFGTQLSGHHRSKELRLITCEWVSSVGTLRGEELGHNSRTGEASEM